MEKTLIRAFRAASVYNILWGLVVIAWPDLPFTVFHLAAPTYPFLMRGIGLFVALYGYGYWAVSRDLVRYPQLVVIGFLGKTLGPIGWLFTVVQGELPPRTLLVNLFNDIIWLPFFVGYFVWYRRHQQGLGSSGGSASDCVATRPTLYERLLGKDFASLPDALRRFHQSASGGVAAGVFQIEGGSTPAGRAIARLLGLPRPARNVATELRVRAVGHREIWERSFGRDHVRTTQWLEQQRLVESLRGTRFTFDVCADHRGIRFHSLGVRWLGIPLPMSLAPHIDAEVVALDDSWEVDVTVTVPKLGVISSYNGQISQVA